MNLDGNFLVAEHKKQAAWLFFCILLINVRKFVICFYYNVTERLLEKEVPKFFFLLITRGH